MEVAQDLRGRNGLEGRDLFLADTPLIDSSMVEGAHLEIDGSAADPGFEHDLALEWNSLGRQKFEEITTVWKGKKVALMLERRILSTPTIIETIRSPFVHVLLSPEHDISRLLRQFNPPVDSAALTSLRQACADGGRQSCMLLGREARVGRDLPHDSALAEEGFANACRLGEGEGCFRAVYPSAFVSRSGGLAVHCRAGARTAKHQSLLRRGCDLQHWASCHVLALAFLECRGYGEAPDVAQATTLFERACDGRLAAACNRLVDLMMDVEGKGALPRAIPLIERSCEYGSADACEALGELALDRGSPDPGAALRWYKAASALDPEGRRDVVHCELTEADKQKHTLKAAAGFKAIKLSCSEASSQ